MVIVDTREKKWSNIRDYFDKHDIGYELKKLDEGDYMNTCQAKKEGKTIVVDRKQNIDEVAINLCTQDFLRFRNELQRALLKNIHIVFLVEQNFKDVEDVRNNWKSKYCKISSKSVASKMHAVRLAYGVEWKFCHKNSTGKTIKEILEIE